MTNSVVVPTATVTKSITVNPRREELKALSNSLKQVAEDSQTSINAALVFFYSEQTGVQAQDFKTLDSWNTMGYMVKKGEKSYSIWGQKTKKTTNIEEGLIAGVPDVVTFYPIVSLFSIDQVIKREPRQTVKAVIEVAEVQEVVAVQALELVKIEVKPTKNTRKGKKVKVAKMEVAQA
jgi:N-terminal domain of anti-restriction factor ArdC